MLVEKKPPVPNRSPPPGFELREALGLVFAFIWFHRNVLVAIVLLYALYHYVNRVSDQVADHRQRDRELVSSDFTLPPSERISKPIDLAPPSLKQDALPKEPLVPQVVDTNRNPTPQIDAETQRFQTFLASASKASLVNRATALARDISKQNPAEAVMFINRRQQVCDRLRQMELSPKQMEAVEIAELEALSQLDAINVQNRMGLPEARAKLLEKAASLANHPSQDVSTKAHLAVIAAAGMDLLTDPTQKTITQFTETYQRHITGVMQGADELRVVGNILHVATKNFLHDDITALNKDLVSRALQAPSVEIREVGASLHTQMVSQDLELGSLVTRIDGTSDFATEDINKLFDQLDEFPAAQPVLYTTAAAVIMKQVDNGELDRAASLAQRLTDLLPRIPVEKAQQFVREQLQRYAERVRLRNERELTQDRDSY